MLLKSLTVITETDGNTVKMPAVKNDFTFLIDDVFNAYPHPGQSTCMTSVN